MSKKFLSPVNLTHGATLPASGSAGDLFFKSDELKIYVHDGSTWVIAQGSGGGSSSITVDEVAPGDPASGNLWFKSSTAQTFIFYDNQWVELTTAGPIGPQGPNGVYLVSSTAPSAPTAGSAWFNTTDGRMYVWSGTEWFEPVSGLQGATGVYAIGTSAPSSPAVGQGWMNTNTGRLYIWSGTEWFEPTNNQAGAQGVSLYGGSVVSSQSSTTVGLVIKGATANTVDLQQWQTVIGTVVGEVSYDGSAGFANQNYAGKNLLINGGFDFWQRTSAPDTPVWKATGDYFADRWAPHQYQSGMMSRSTVTVGLGPFSRYAHRVGSVTTAQEAGGSRMVIAQKIESNNVYPLRGRLVTLSFWARFASAAFTSTANSGESTFGDFVYSLGYNTTTTDSALGTTGFDSDSLTSIYNGSLPTSWTKYVKTVVVPADANNITLRFGFQSRGSTTSSGTNWYEVTDVQLEQGSVATPFSRAGGDIQGELAKCERYYKKSYNLDLGPGSATSAGASYSSWATAANTGNKLAGFDYARMRTTPSVALYDSAGNLDKITLEVSAGVVTNNVAHNGVYGQGHSRALVLYTGGANTSGFSFQWTANAEI